MSEQNNTITLYPSNWLYNAGVVGLMNILEENNVNLSEVLNNDGIQTEKLIKVIENLLDEVSDQPLRVPFNRFSKWHWGYIDKSFKSNYGSIENTIRQSLTRAKFPTGRTQVKKQMKIDNLTYIDSNKEYEINFDKKNEFVDNAFSELFGRNPTRDYDSTVKELAESFLQEKEAFIYRKTIGNLFSKGSPYQNLFNINYYKKIDKFLEVFTKSFFLNNSSNGNKCSFCCGSKYEVETLDTMLMASLFPAFSQFPNAFWNNDPGQGTKVCGLCKFLILHHHLALTKLSDYTEIFINAPSFKIMFELNKIIKEAYGSSNSEEARSKREILATTVIEYSRKLQSTIGLWSGMNIEIVTKSKEGVDFFSLPYDVIKIISDRKIASTLSDIGEFRILDIVLNRKYSLLTEIAYKLLRESTKSKKNDDLLKKLLYRSSNRFKLTETANKILMLYTLIEEKIKRS